jgi:type IV pilus assembly protein PilN
VIRINLLNVERGRAKKKAAAGFQTGQKLTIGCSLILVAALAFVTWRYFALNRESAKIDADIIAAQQETVRLHSIIQQVQQFEQRRTQLQERVALIEQLRKGQTGPVHMLDQISLALPQMLWLIELRQTEKVPGEVTIDGRCTTLTGLSDFVKNLEDSGYFRKSVEVVSSTTEPIPQPPGTLIRFQVRAVFQQPVSKDTVAKAR